ncbi:MAG: hypothetical protein K9N47_17390 [Prosthecobacter sp.]|uniref:hypothetical protein n=1 Tax=Prosthecobacter sp. TaxID=1965333 RepID=UPI0025F50999|nr:hypothetical protein [Prosthecobacter sp.]MCF7787898.1 hypothetical protein [Prosthecobacter sp.]
MKFSSLLVHTTAGVAFLAYIAALGQRLMRNGARVNAGRAWWTAGCLALLVHVACAFHFVHHWSHRAAYEATAQQTAAVTGLVSGAGVWVNYAVLAVWFLDVCWWWLVPARHASRSRSAEWLLQGFLAFVWFNATVIFGHGVVRWLGLAASLWLSLLEWRRPHRGLQG